MCEVAGLGESVQVDHQVQEEQEGSPVLATKPVLVTSPRHCEVAVLIRTVLLRLRWLEGRTVRAVDGEGVGAPGAVAGGSSRANLMREGRGQGTIEKRPADLEGCDASSLVIHEAVRTKVRGQLASPALPVEVALVRVRVRPILTQLVLILVLLVLLATARGEQEQDSGEQEHGDWSRPAH